MFQSVFGHISCCVPIMHTFRASISCVGKATIFESTMPTSSIEKLSPELLQMIADFLPPSDVLSLSSATKKATFLRPDFDVNKNMMVKARD